jgi:hypothetical protein
VKVEKRFTQLAIADRVRIVDRARRELRELSHEVGFTFPSDFVLPRASQEWLEKMTAALCDHRCSDPRFLELDAELCEYYETVAEVEAEELSRRLSEFRFVRDALIDVDANAKQALPAVLERIRQLAEA